MAKIKNQTKNEKRAKQILKNEQKARNEHRNQSVKHYIEAKMLRGHSLEQASKMAQALIDNQ